MKAAVKRAVYALWPGAQETWIRLNQFATTPTFSGWGMSTYQTRPPWADADALAVEFNRAHNDLLRAMRSGDFSMTLAKDAADKARWLDGLRYRNYTLFWSVTEGVERSGVRVGMECGSADGMSAWFALAATDATIHLYDAWTEMGDRALLDSEKGMVGQYGDLSRDRTAANLAPFAQHVRLHQGFVPDAFIPHPPPQELGWLHIDINSAAATVAILETVWGNLAPGATLVFDDYGWMEDTKRRIDAFLSGRPERLIQLPTGQAIVNKR